MGIRVLVADDHRLVREAISFRLSAEQDMEVVRQAEDGRTAVRLARELRPDVIIMDVGMPSLNGIGATRQIVHELPGGRVIGFSGGLDRRCVREMLAAGASGYLLKNASFEELLTAIRNVVSNHTYLSPQVCGVVVEGYVGRSADTKSPPRAGLTAREREVLQLIAEGRSTKTAAKELCLSTKTIEWHRSRIMKKLGIDNVAGLVRYAIAEGLTSADLTSIGAW